MGEPQRIAPKIPVPVRLCRAIESILSTNGLSDKPGTVQSVSPSRLSTAPSMTATPSELLWDRAKAATNGPSKRSEESRICRTDSSFTPMPLLVGGNCVHAFYDTEAYVSRAESAPSGVTLIRSLPAE